MSDASFSGLLKKSFGNAAAPSPEELARQRTRIDARTVGYPADDNIEGLPGRVEWMGMSPAPDSKGKTDLWRVVMVSEEMNRHLAQVDENERLITFQYNTAAEPMSFEQAVERLAVWEQARMMRGFTPAFGQSRDNIGRHSFRDLAMRRGLIASTTGKIAPVTTIVPQNSGQYLKSDLEAMEKYWGGKLGADPLSELISAHDPIYVGGTLEQDIEKFGEINLFDRMELFAGLLVAYAGAKLSAITDFYARPNDAPIRDRLLARINDGTFLTADLLDRYNTLRTEYTGPVFRMFHMVASDWAEPLDVTRRDFKVELAKNPDAHQTYTYLTTQLKTPLDQNGLEALLTVCARSLLYCRAMLEGSSQKEVLEQKGLYRPQDIEDLLNYLDLLEIKTMHAELSQVAFALPGTQRYKEIKSKKDDFTRRVLNLKDNLRDAGKLSPAQDAEVDSFIKTSTPVYMIERIAQLPATLAKTQAYITDALLPKPMQLSLDLDYTVCGKKRVAAPTRQTRDQWTNLTRKP